ncbi:MAG: OadG family protein [Bacteroidota bacterium]|jgi:sodium pump decarboxylase gamma subunit
MIMFMNAPAAVDTATAIVRTVQSGKLSGMENIMAGNGPTVTVVGMFVVFSALAIMSLTIYYIARLSQRSFRKPTEGNAPVAGTALKTAVSGEIIAAIAIALERQINQYHDQEDAVLTIKRVSRPYSPWSSKLHGITRPPDRHHSHA